MLRKLFHIIAWIGVFAYLAMALSFTHRMEKEQKVEYIQVELMDSAEFQFINRDDVIKQLMLHGLRITGMHVDSINRSAIQSVVKDISEVKDASVFYTPDNDLHIRIWQRRPVVRIKSGKMDFYLDEQNNPLPVSPRFSPRVLIMTGAIDLELAQEKLFNLALFIRDDSFYSSLVQEIHIDDKQYLEIIPRIGNQRIYLGEATNYEWKFTKLMAFYEKAIPNLGWDKYISIDLRYGDQIVCKKADNNSIN